MATNQRADERLMSPEFYPYRCPICDEPAYVTNTDDVKRTAHYPRGDDRIIRAIRACDVHGIVKPRYDDLRAYRFACSIGPED